MDYCPHLMWDPWTGRIVQYYPANQSARAARNAAGGVETNRQGQVCIQIEVFFSPGAVRGGKKYMTVADTPCVGLEKIVAWLRSWGIPDVWPSGWPDWSGNTRSASTWVGTAGHYGHCHVPENTHTDPGPMPRDMFANGSAEREGELDMDAKAVYKAVWETDAMPAPDGDPAKNNPTWKPTSVVTDTNKEVRALRAEVASLSTAVAEIKALLIAPKA